MLSVESISVAHCPIPDKNREPVGYFNGAGVGRGMPTHVRLHKHTTPSYP